MATLRIELSEPVPTVYIFFLAVSTTPGTPLSVVTPNVLPPASYTPGVGVELAHTVLEFTTPGIPSSLRYGLSNHALVPPVVTASVRVDNGPTTTFSLVNNASRDILLPSLVANTVIPGKTEGSVSHPWWYAPRAKYTAEIRSNSASHRRFFFDPVPYYAGITVEDTEYLDTADYYYLFEAGANYEYGFFHSKYGAIPIRSSAGAVGISANTAGSLTVTDGYLPPSEMAKQIEKIFSTPDLWTNQISVKQPVVANSASSVTLLDRYASDLVGRNEYSDDKFVQCLYLDLTCSLVGQRHLDSDHAVFRVVGRLDSAYIQTLTTQGMFAGAALSLYNDNGRVGIRADLATPITGKLFTYVNGSVTVL